MPVLILYIGLMIVPFTLLYSSYNWIFEFSTHFLPYIVAIGLLAIWIGILRKDWVLVIIILSVFLPVRMVMQSKSPDPIGVRTGYEMSWFDDVNNTKDYSILKAISYNVLTGNTNYTAVLRFLKKQNADIIFLSEINMAWAKALSLLKTNYPCIVEHPREDNFGLMLLAKFPCDINLEKLDENIPFVTGMFNINGKQLHFMGLHTLPPISERMANSRDRQLMEMAGRVQKISGPVLVTGDLNNTIFAPSFKRMLHQSGLRYPSPYYGYQFSWPRIPLLQIDHMLKRNIRHTAMQVHHRSYGSDHRPLILKAALP